jgi:hypothetical protein
MILGALLACMMPQDASTCTVVPWEKEIFMSMESCQTEMTAFAKYTANNFQLVTRPYCFKLPTNSI